MLGDQDPPTELGPAYKKSCVSDADWLQLKQGGARPRALDSRWRRLGSEFRRSGGKGKRPAASTAPPPLLMSSDSMRTGTSLGFIPTAKRREGCYRLTLALPASTFLRRCSCSSSISVWAPRESLGGGRTAAKPPSLYLHSLPSPTRLPTPIHTTVSAAPPIRSPVWPGARALQ